MRQTLTIINSYTVLKNPIVSLKFNVEKSNRYIAEKLKANTINLLFFFVLLIFSMLLNAFRFVDKQSYSYRALARRGRVKNRHTSRLRDRHTGGVSGRLGGGSTPSNPGRGGPVRIGTYTHTVDG